MNLQQAISILGGPSRGQSTIIAAVLSGNLKPISGMSAENPTKESALSELSRHRKMLNECQSDWAYWGHLSDVEYWGGIVDLIEASEINEDLPDIPKPPDWGVTIMDVIHNKRQWCAKVLSAAKKEPPLS